MHKNTNKQPPFRQTLNISLAYLHIFIAILAASTVTSCGKRRPPVPPVRRVAPTTSIVASQKGSTVLLQIPLNIFPDVSRYRQIDVYRLAETAGSPSILNEDEFAARSTLVGSITLNPSLLSKATVNFDDALSLAPGSVRLRYAVRFVNSEGQKTSFSNFALFETTSNVAQPPTLLNVEVESENVKLEWQSPTKNLNGTTPPNLAGYNVYRRTGDKILRLNSNPITATNFSDRAFEFGNEYEYFVRVISTAINGSNIESEDSNKIKVVARDIFAPAAPDGLTVAAAPGRLSLFFAANSETDVKGYIIYRSNNENLAKDQWDRLNQEPIGATTYQDEKVESGVRYYYYVRAVDAAGNLSEPSEAVSEIAP
jgi:fibronectin type 3 domain-containing protein